VAQLAERYRDEIVGAMMERFGYRNRLAVPRLTKIVVSSGIGRASEEKERFEQSISDLTLITGQKAVGTQARKSVAGFKIREGMIVGSRVTLRGARMHEFMERLISVAIPRIRDFRGLSPKGFDGQGNFSFGISEQVVFPEIDPDSVKVTQGMNVTIVTTARTDEEGRELLRQFGMPFTADDTQN
jgi:large subunit ribosomal protein L5